MQFELSRVSFTNFQRQVTFPTRRYLRVHRVIVLNVCGPACSFTMHPLTKAVESQTQLSCSALTGQPRPCPGHQPIAQHLTLETRKPRRRLQFLHLHLHLRKCFSRQLKTGDWRS